MVGLGPQHGRADIVRVAREFAATAAAGGPVGPITPDVVSQRLSSALGGLVERYRRRSQRPPQAHTLPDPELLITFGRHNVLGGVLPWQLRVTEIL